METEDYTRTAETFPQEEKTAKVNPAMLVALPTKKAPASSLSPRRLLIYSSPKAGKTSLMAGLNDCLLLDLEAGSGFVSAMRYECKSHLDIYNFVEACKAQKVRYKYLAVDTVTKLEELALPLAKAIYMNTPQGKNFKLDNVLHLADGAGYRFLREAVEMLLNMISQVADHVILLGHLKDKFIGDVKIGGVSAKDIDLTGKIKNIACANADAIGYLYRKNGNQTMLSFKTSEEITCGARPAHLSNQELLMAEKKEDGTLVTYWEKVFID